MTNALTHRGPDAGGVWADPAIGIALAHRRLAIVELSPAGAQPMLSPSGRYVLAFNGEIYNHLELRATLERDGPIAWKGHSDTETLVHAIERWGLADTLERAVGMFALACWDRHKSRLALARDRIGEKPLFWGWSANGLVFASELKAMRALPWFDNPVDPAVLGLFLRFNYVPAPYSILRGIYKVEPGTIVTIEPHARVSAPDRPPTAERNGSVPGVRCQRYWSLAEVAARGVDDSLTDETAVATLEQRLTEAVRLQTVADVPVGAFLSGGVDSSAIVALMCATSAHVRTFTMGFGEAGFDEAPYARAVAAQLGTEHTEMYVTSDDVRAVIPELPRIYDEPFADSSQIPTILLSRLTRRSVTVALSGDAGDELFGGYNRYLVPVTRWNAARRLPAPVRGSMASAIGAVPPTVWDRLGRLPGIPAVSQLGNKMHKLGHIMRGEMTTRDIYRAAAEEWHGSPPTVGVDALDAPVDALTPVRTTVAEQMMEWDMMSYLPDDVLVKVDRAAMASSLETRVPFLDHRVVEQAWRMPLRFKLRDGQGKWVLRQILYRHVPRSIIERPKAGFAIPIGAWLRGPLRDWADNLLNEKALARQPALDAARIARHWAEHLSGRYDRTGALWGVLMFQAWAAEWETGSNGAGPAADQACLAGALATI